jgi:hypothetical protein
MIRPKSFGPKNWLMIKTGAIRNAIKTKPSYKTVSDIDIKDNNKVVQPKVDGAHTLIALTGRIKNDIYSYRTSKRTGKNVEHSNQVPHLRDLKVPKSLAGTVVRADLYGKTDHTAMSAEQVSGILNSGVKKSLAKQEQIGKLQPYVYDIDKFKGKDVSKAGYAEKFKLLKQIEAKIPELRVAETATTPSAKEKLIKQIKGAKHPDTKEGVVEWDLTRKGGSPTKMKFRDNYEVFIRKIFPAIDKAGKTKNEAGGFEYSWGPKGPIVGNVGTGFNREQKIDMLKNKSKYIGGVARVKSQQKFQSGALRAPAFYSMHVERNLEKHADISQSILNFVRRAQQRIIDNGVRRRIAMQFRKKFGLDRIKEAAYNDELRRMGL